MSRFFSKRHKDLTPYVPGEQPRVPVRIKLNTNELPFPPSEAALAYAASHTRPLNLYSDPESVELREELGKLFGFSPEEILLGNGSDELIHFCFLAFCDREHPAVFPDVTYGFYPVSATLNHVPYETIPLREDFTVDPRQYYSVGKTIFLTNPNAPTGIALSLGEIEEIVRHNRENVVVVDEAYVDFGATTALPLVKRYDNVVVLRTFSKSRSLAGGRVGFAIGCRDLIADLNTLRNSQNPYNISSPSTALAIGILKDEEQTLKNCAAIAETRTRTVRALREMGFTVVDSVANFIFVRAPGLGGEAFQLALRQKGILVRHFGDPRIADYNRVTIGTRDQMDDFLAVCAEILEAKK